MKRFLSYSCLFFVVLLSSCSGDLHRKTDVTGYPSTHFTTISSSTFEPVSLICHNGSYSFFYQVETSSGSETRRLAKATSKDLLNWVDSDAPIFENSNRLLYASIVRDSLNLTHTSSLNNVALFVLKSKSKASLSFELNKNTENKWTALNEQVAFPTEIEATDKPTLIQDDQTQKWIITLARKTAIFIYSSSDLKSWQLESTIEKQRDWIDNSWLKAVLAPMPESDNWTLLIDVDENAPNGGPGTAYFTGKFDGKLFVSNTEKIHWLDYGPNNHRNIVCTGLPQNDSRTLLLSVIDNFKQNLSNKENSWGSLLCLPKEITLETVYNEWLLACKPASELNGLKKKVAKFKDLEVVENLDISRSIPFEKTPVEINLKFETVDVTRLSFASQFGLRLENDQNESLTIGYDYFRHWYYVDRSNFVFSKTNYPKGDAQMMPCYRADSSLTFHLIVDNSSIELFTEEGKLVMSEAYCASSKFNKIILFTEKGAIKLIDGEVAELGSIWKK